jgi:hypothetical protein
VARLVPPNDHPPADLAATITRLRAFNASQCLGGLSWRDLRDDDRP